jgi:hypothetical protein
MYTTMFTCHTAYLVPNCKMWHKYCHLHFKMLLEFLWLTSNSLLVCHKSCKIKFRYCEKATKIEKIFHLILKLLCKVKTKLKIFSSFLAFSEYLNYTRKNIKNSVGKRKYTKMWLWYHCVVYHSQSFPIIDICRR